MKVLLADDHELVSSGLRVLIEECSDDIAVVAEARDGAQAIHLARKHRPDVVAMDITMPGLNGIEATRCIRSDPQINSRVLILSMHTDAEFVAEAFRAGATGYVVKTSATEQFLTALNEVAHERTYLSPEVAGSVMQTFVDGDADTPRPRYTLLSPRERQTLQLLAEGKAAKEIAHDLGLSDKTVHAFRSRVMDKLGIHSVAELTKYAVRHGLTPLN